MAVVKCLVSVTRPTDFGTLNIWDFQLGLSRRYKIGTIFKGKMDFIFYQSEAFNFI